MFCFQAIKRRQAQERIHSKESDSDQNDDTDEATETETSTGGPDTSFEDSALVSKDEKVSNKSLGLEDKEMLGNESLRKEGDRKPERESLKDSKGERLKFSSLNAKSGIGRLKKIHAGIKRGPKGGSSLGSKLKIRLPHTKTSLHNKLKQRVSLGSVSNVRGPSGLPRGRPPKDHNKLLARQQLLAARQLGESRGLGGLFNKKRGRPLGSKNKVKRIKEEAGKGGSPGSVGGNVTTAEIKRSHSVGGKSQSNVLKRPKKQLSIPNGQCDRALISPHTPRISPGSGGSSGSNPLGKSPGVDQPTPAELRAFWRPSDEVRPLLDSVLITDVTSNSTTITIRESTTDTGFFKNACT